jgi:hypothetical protein
VIVGVELGPISHKTDNNATVVIASGAKQSPKFPDKEKVSSGDCFVVSLLAMTRDSVRKLKETRNEQLPAK